MQIIRIALILTILFMTESIIAYADPLIGCTLIETNSARTATFKDMFVSSISQFCETFGTGETVNSALLDDQVKKFGCTDDRCLLSMMRDAKINILITGSIKEKNDRLEINIVAKSYDNPFHGKAIITWRNSIAANAKISIREIGYIAQEEAALFLSALFEEYVTLLPVKSDDPGNMIIAQKLSGEFDIYRVISSGDDGLFTVKEDAVRVENGKVMAKIDMGKGLFVAKSFKKESDNIYQYIYGRKKEIVCEPRKFEHSLFSIPIIPFLSVSSPISIPAGYYMNSDYHGLAISVVNSSPWWYFSWKGLGGKISNLKNAGSELKRHDDGKYLFALYTAAFGSCGYVIDMMAQDSLKKAGSYRERVPYICNDFTAVTLSLLVPGGGMFYRGNRLWGSIYYQIDNGLAYVTIRNIAERKNNKTAYCLSALIAVKAIEVIHSSFMRDEIFTGEFTGNSIILPTIEAENDGSLRAGFAAALRW